MSTTRPAARANVLPLDPNGPACQCCSHITVQEMARDDLLGHIWDHCPELGCLSDLCPLCEAQEAERGHRSAG